MNILPRKTVKIILIVEQSNNGRTNRVERLRILLTFESHYAHMLILGCLNFVSLGHRLVFSVDVISLFFLKKFSFNHIIPRCTSKFSRLLQVVERLISCW